MPSLCKNNLRFSEWKRSTSRVIAPIFKVACLLDFAHDRNMRFSKYFLWLALFFISLLDGNSRAWAYASFIGYGYAQCMTCHYDPHGNGQLNDYGRALFAAEIAAKPFWSPKATDEELGKTSSFTFREPDQRAFHPSLKYRELYLTTSPGGDSTTKKYVMQADLGMAWHFDPEDHYIFVASAGYTRVPLNSDIKEGAWNYHFLSREHYLRMQLGEAHFLSVGLMDVAYGIRLVDHTAANRQGIGLDQNSQVHGVLYNYIKDKWMVGVHGFVGNQMRDEISRVSGASTTAEYEVREKVTVGASALSGSTQVYKQTLFGLHSRLGIGKGSSLLTEWGVNRLEPKGADSTTGAYGILVGTMRLIRGLDFESQVEMLKTSMNESANENYKYSFGLIYFPFQRAELRIRATDLRSYSPTQVAGDTWTLQSQWHLSL